MTQTEQNITALPAQYYLSESEQNDEIDLLELVVSIIKQWKIIVLISIVGTLIGVVYAFNLPKQYENFTLLRTPMDSDLKIITLNGYNVDLDGIFLRFYDDLKSPELIKQFLLKSEFIMQFYPNIQSKDDIYLAALGISSSLEVDFIDTENKKSKGGGQSRLLRLTLQSSNELVAISLLNQYVLHTQQVLLKQISAQGKYAINLRKQEIEQEIATLRGLAKHNRQNAITQLKETLKVAVTLDVKKPLISLPTNNSKSNTLTLFLSQSKQQQAYMVGSDYLAAEINRLEERGFEMTSDDAFIGKMPALLSELKTLNKKTFNFENAKLYTLDKLAALNDAPVKPNKKLIAIIGMLLSGFLALFVALIVSTIQKRKSMASETKTS